MPQPPDSDASDDPSTGYDPQELNPYAVDWPVDADVMAASSTMTKARFKVLGVLCLLSGVLYLDRICISAAVDSIQTDLKITNTQTSYFLMAFTLAYGLFEIPTGRWGDRLGARRVLTRISLWWSAFTALTGTASAGLPYTTACSPKRMTFPGALRTVMWDPIGDLGPDDRR